MKERNGRIVIENKTARSLFEDAIKQIAKQTDEMLQSDDLRNVDLNEMFLVGGFASCKLLQSHMRASFSKRRISVPSDAQTAVVKGAVIYGSNPKKLTRIAKKTYGVSTYSDFDPNRHSQQKKKSFGGKALCEGVFFPFVQKGEVLEPGTHGQMVANPITPDTTCLVIDFYCLDRTTKKDEVYRSYYTL